MIARAAWLALALAAVGCRSELNPAYCAAHPSDSRCAALEADGAVDTPTGPDARTCVGKGTYEVCLAAAPTAPQTVTTNINTNGNLCLDPAPADWIAAGQPDACFVVGTDLATTSLTARGTRPLVLVATGTLTVNGFLDVAGRRDDPTNPAGFDPTACAAFAATPVPNNGGSGGAAGGTFGTKGGDGGTGDGGTFAAGKAASVGPLPAVLRAGCAGQNGIGGTGSSTVPPGGVGGGAIYLVAGTSIVFTDSAAIDASGAGGSAGAIESGGAGGGAGGMIVLSAPSIAFGNGIALYANGGGGAGGGGNSTPGGNGLEPMSPAAGGNGGTSSNAGSGGAGASASADAGSGSGGGGGLAGGGGGGGAGYIATDQALTGADVSPAATSL